MAFLNQGINDYQLKINVKISKRREFHYEGGIKSYVEHLNRTKEVIHEEPIYVEGEKDGIQVEIAIQYNDGYTSNIYSFANNINTHEGGTHEVRF